MSELPPSPAAPAASASSTSSSPRARSSSPPRSRRAVVNRLLGRAADGLPVPYQRGQLAVVVGVIAVTLLVGALTGGEYGYGLLGAWAVLSISTLGFYLVFGLSGQFAFSQAAFMAVGGYTSVAVARHAGFLAGFVSAIVVAALVAALLALLISRTEHFAFAIATLAFGFVATVVFREWEDISGPGGEVLGIERPSLFGHTFATDEALFPVLVGALAIALVVVALVERSPVRREAIAVRDNPVVATLSGVFVQRRRMLLFTLGSAFAGAAGSLLAHRSAAIFPETFSLQLAINLFLALLFGGMGSMWGPLLGALFVTQVPERLRFVGRYQDLIYGALLVVIIVAVPDGLAGVTGRASRALRAYAHRRGRTTATARAPLEADEAAGPAAADEPGAAAGESAVPGRQPPGQGRTSGPAGDAAPALAARDIDVRFGGVRAVAEVGLTVGAGEIVGLVGPNGSGKSTFLNAITGLVPAVGSLEVGGAAVPLRRPARVRAAGVGRTFQTPQVVEGLTCLENVMLAVPERRLAGLGAALGRRRAMISLERARAQRARAALARVGLAELADTPANQLAYGWRRRLELARVLVAEPKVVLLDEPAAGLNEAETRWLAEMLRSLRAAGCSLLIVEHKLALLNDICDRLVVLRLGEVVAAGEPAAVWADPRVVEAYLGGGPAAPAPPAPAMAAGQQAAGTADAPVAAPTTAGGNGDAAS